MKRYQIILLVILLALAVTTAVNSADGPAILRQRFVAFGMKPKTNASYTLRGTLGQPMAGITSNPPRQLCNGIWCGWPFLYEVQMPVVMRY